MFRKFLAWVTSPTEEQVCNVLFVLTMCGFAVAIIGLIITFPSCYATQITKTNQEANIVNAYINLPRPHSADVDLLDITINDCDYLIANDGFIIHQPSCRGCAKRLTNRENNAK